MKGSHLDSVISGLTALSQGQNNLTMGAQIGFSIEVDEGMTAWDGGKNTLQFSQFSSGGQWPFEPGSFTLFGGMEAKNGGLNSIQCSVDPDNIFLHGAFTYEGDTAPGTRSGNRVTLNDGDDYLLLEATVGEHGLYLSGGAGTDTLTLVGDNAADMADRYQLWLETAAEGGSPQDFGSFETIRVLLDDPSEDLHTLTWLSQAVDSFATGASTQIDLELSLDEWSDSLHLGDFFTPYHTDDIFTAVTLEGGQYANTLHVNGSLDDNGIAAYFFKVHGDAEDSVSLSDDWTFVGSDESDGLAYSYYTTGFDLLMIESEINVLFGA